MVPMLRQPYRDGKQALHYYKYECSCWNFLASMCLASRLEEHYVEQQAMAGIKHPVPLGLVLRPITMAVLEHILDSGDEKNHRLWNVMTNHFQQVWAGSLKPLNKTRAFLNLVTRLHTYHRIRVTPPPSMIVWQSNKQRHNELLQEKGFSTPTILLDTKNLLSQKISWSELMHQGTEALVELGNDSTPCPVSLVRAQLERTGVVIKFDHDGLGNVIWIHQSFNDDDDGETFDEDPEKTVVHTLPLRKTLWPSAGTPEEKERLSSFYAFVKHGVDSGDFSMPVNLLVQPYMLSLENSSTALYYCLDKQNKLQPLAEMILKPNGEVISMKEGPDGTEICRLRDKVKKIWREKLEGKPNFKLEVGNMITDPRWGLHKQTFLPFRVDAYTDKKYGRNKDYCLVNSVGVFPLVDIESVEGCHEIAELVIDRYCDWATDLLEGYPTA